MEGVVLRRSLHIKEKMLPRLMQTNPDLKEQYAAKLKDLRQFNSTIRDAKAMAEINATIEPILDQVETQLLQTQWLCGSTYSLADTVWTAVLNRLDELKFGYFWQHDARPALDSYFNRLKARPSFRTAIRDDKMPLPMLWSGLGRILLGI
jgi:glutathione S-transferase